MARRYDGGITMEINKRYFKKALIYTPWYSFQLYCALFIEEGSKKSIEEIAEQYDIPYVNGAIYYLEEEKLLWFTEEGEWKIAR